MGIEIVQILEGAGGEEGVADEADRPLDPALLIPPCWSHGTGLEVVVGGEFQQSGMKADRLPHALEHGTLEIIVEQDTRHRIEKGEGLDVTAQKVAHGGVEIEA